MKKNNHSERLEVEKTQQQASRNLSNRLDKLYFKDEDDSTFDAAAGTHKANRITFVTKDDSTVELYKGDTKISGAGGENKAIMYSKTAYDYNRGGTVSNIEPHTTGGDMDPDITSDRLGNVSVENVKSPPAISPVIVPFQGLMRSRNDGTTFSSGSNCSFSIRDYGALYFGYTNESQLTYVSPITLNTGTFKNHYGEDVKVNGINILNRCSYDSIAIPILRYENTSKRYITTEVIVLNLLVGGLMINAISNYIDPNTGIAYSDYDWDTVKRMIYYSWPIIRCDRYVGVNNGIFDEAFSYSAGSYMGSWYYAPFTTNFSYNNPINFSTTKVPSELKNVSYSRQEVVNNSPQYNKEFAACGLCIILTSIPQDCDYFFTDSSEFLAESVITKFNYYNTKPELKYCQYNYLKPTSMENPVKRSGNLSDVVTLKTFKPRIGLILENSYELYGGGIGCRDQTVRIHLLPRRIPGLDVVFGPSPVPENDYMCVPTSYFGLSNFFTYNIIQKGKYEK